MFQELMPLIEHRPLSITVAALLSRATRSWLCFSPEFPESIEARGALPDMRENHGGLSIPEAGGQSNE